MNRHLALVEDDETILANYADFLEESGFRVDRYGAKEEAMRGLLAAQPELLLLDVELHDELDAGFSICRELRRLNPRLPIIFITSHGDEVDRISGARLDADDYITKPVSLDLLVERIKSLLRRIDTRSTAPVPINPKASGRAASAMAINEAASTVYWRGRHIDLPLTQVWMVRALHVAHGQVLSAKALMEAGGIVVEPNTIAAHIMGIRTAFRRVDPTFDAIKTERSRGYRWVEVSPQPDPGAA